MHFLNFIIFQYLSLELHGFLGGAKYDFTFFRLLSF